LEYTLIQRDSKLSGEDKRALTKFLEMVHHADENSRINFLDYLSKKLNHDYQIIKIKKDNSKEYITTLLKIYILNTF